MLFRSQILETFSSREDAGEVERRLIKSVYNTDKWCLNESCGGAFSLDTCSRAGKIAGQKTYEMKVGVHNRTEEQRQIDAKKGGLVGGKIAYEMKVGVHNRTEEQRKIDAKKGGLVGGKLVRELGVGIHGRTKEQKIEDGRKGGLVGGKLSRELGVGIYGRTKEQKIEDGKKGGSISGKKNYENGIGLASITKEERKEIVAKTNSQKWMCLETGYITTSGPLTAYQNARGIDTSKRKRIG